MRELFSGLPVALFVSIGRHRQFLSTAHVAEAMRCFDQSGAGAFMKTLLAMVVGTLLLLDTGIASAQNGNIMNGGTSSAGWMNGYNEYGGIGGPILLVIVVVALVAWAVHLFRQ